MCLAIPGKLISIAADDDGYGPTGTVDFSGSRLEVSLALAPDAAVGDWLLVHAGLALRRVDEAEARRTWEYLREAEIVEGVPGGTADRDG